MAMTSAITSLYIQSLLDQVLNCDFTLFFHNLPTKQIKAKSIDNDKGVFSTNKHKTQLTTRPGEKR